MPPSRPPSPIDEIRRLYYAATAQTIQRDLERAIEILKTLPDEAQRQQFAVYMDGLSQMRSEWSAAAKDAAARPRSEMKREKKPGQKRQG